MIDISKQIRTVKEGMYKTQKKKKLAGADEEKEVFVRGFMIDGELQKKSYFTLVKLSDKEGLHEWTEWNV